MPDSRGHQPPVLPPLARAGIDRAAAERTDAELLARLRADDATRVVGVHGDRALVEASGARLHLVATADVTPEAEWAFLGRNANGVAVLLAATAAGGPAPVGAGPSAEGAADAPGSRGTAGSAGLIEAPRWRALREVGGELDAVEAGLFVEAVSLGRWLVDAPFCSACGARTLVRSAGWARHCPQCGREHFPRTDPAVIVAVQSADGERLLLGKNALWAQRNMYSTFAGFVEAGESLESAITREVLEEAAVEVVETRYRGSQAWPYPRSLMLGFFATVEPGAVARADGEEIVDVRWFTRGELSAALAAQEHTRHRHAPLADAPRPPQASTRPDDDDAADADAAPAAFGLPGTASIAHRLIVDWVERAA